MRNIIIFRVENCLVNIDADDSFKKIINRERWRDLKVLKDLEETCEKVRCGLKKEDIKEKKREVLKEKLRKLEEKKDGIMSDEGIQKIWERNEMKVKNMERGENEIKRKMLSVLGEDKKRFFDDLDSVGKKKNIDLRAIGEGCKGLIERMLYNNGIKNFKVIGLCKDGNIYKEVEDVENKDSIVIFSNSKKDIEGCGESGVRVVNCDWKI